MSENLPLNREDSFTKAIDLFYLAKQNGIDILLKDDQLQLKLPDNQEINKGLLEKIKENKPLIIEFLSNRNWKSKSVDKNYNKVNKIDRDSIKRIPLSFSQERLWFIDQLEGSIQYHSADVLQLKGRVNTDALQHSLKTIVDRHEVLRTVIREDETGPFQYIKDNNTFQLSIINGGGFLNDTQGLSHFIDKLINEPFDLAKDDMLRVSLITLNDEDHVLVIILHHIASDGWSRSIFVNELAELYRAWLENRPAALAPLDIQFADFAVWQRQYLQGEVLNKKLDYWKKKLDGINALQLPTDYLRPFVQSSKGTSTDFKIDAELSRQLKQLSQKQGVTLFITLLSAFKVLLYRYCNQEDICVGTSIADRPQREVEELIGFFVNTLALRSEVNGNNSFIELLQQVKITILEAYDHQDLPFEKVVEAVVKERDTSRHPLFQVMLVLGNTTNVPEMRLGEVVVSRQAITHNASKFDLTFFLLETTDGLQLTVAYSTDLFSLQTINRMIGHFNQLLSAIVNQPDQKIGKIQMLTTEEEKQLLEEFNNNTVDYPKDKNVVALFEEQVTKSPDSIAVVFEHDQLSYGQLNEKANQLAYYLRSKGVKEDILVPLCIDRSLEMMIGILGILKAGAAYVPVDPEYPKERISFMLEDTNAQIVVTSKENSSKFSEEDVELIELDSSSSEVYRMPVENVQSALKPHHLAYVIYTSGSTGKPKGVMIEHRNLLDYVFGLQQKVHIDECSSFALVSSISTDLGNTVLYSSLIFGGALHLFSKEAINDGYVLNKYFKEQAIDCLKIVPSHWKALSINESLLLPVKMLIFGGEALQADLVENIKSTGTNCTVVNHYGPTETTVGKLLHVIEPEKKYTTTTIPIGKPFSNTDVYILSKDQALCPIGVPGELLIGGDGVARGYVNNEDLTGKKFIPNPFNGQDRSLIYRTGDRVKYNNEGNIEFLGRIDEQVKIRGFRIEPGEIENVIEQSELVRQAVALAKEDNHGNKVLVGYVVADGFFDRNGIVSYLKDRLPEYMIPALWVELESFPLIANGKIDRKALPDPGAMQGTIDQFELPKNELESKLAVIWQDLLEVEQVGIHDNFFELGGHSLLAIQLISTIRKQLEVEVAIGDIFDYPTIALLAEQFKTQSSTTLLPAIKIQSRPERIPLSFNQERLWFIDQTQGSVQYHRPDVLRLKGEINKEALSFALQTIINRHEVLRIVILNHEGEPYQYIKDKDDWKLSFINGSQYQNNPERLQQYVDRLIEKPFDLSKDSMIRAHLIELNQQEHLLVVTMHHIASDGWSFSLFIKELAEIYRSYVEGQPLQLHPLTLQYADYAIWQRNYLKGELLDKKLSYWKDKLEGVAPLQLPTDYPRPAVLSSKGAMITFDIDSSLSEGLQQLSQEQGTTLFMTMLAAFNVLLYRYSSQADICVGSAIAGRQQKEIEGLIGFFVNTLALRTEVNADASFIELLQQVRTTTLEAYEHQEVSFEKVVNAVIKERDRSRNPLFQVMFDLGTEQNTSKLNLGQLEISSEAFEHKTTKFDLSFSIAQVNRELKGFITYSTDLYEEQTVLRMAGHYNKLLTSILKEPKQKIGKLPMLTAAEERQLLVEFNNTEVAYPKDKTVVDLFEEQVAKTPNNIAVIFEVEQLTYGELNKRANQLAHYLQSKGVKEETLVPICIERNLEMIVGILAILKAGAAYVPIDLEYPQDRINFMIEDTAASIILTNQENRINLTLKEGVDVINIFGNSASIEEQSVENLQTATKSHHLVYVIYTSGSTGKPKGVMIEHRSLVNYLVNTKTQYVKDEESKSGTFMHLSYTFDASLTGLFMPLLAGKSIVIGSNNKVNIFEQSILHKNAPYNFIKATPSHLELLRTSIEDFNQGFLTKRLVIGGEALFLSHFDYLVQKGVDIEIINEYGPTEATVGCSTYSFQTLADNEKIKDRILIGKPIDNVQLYILGSENELLPIGIFGEICISGAGLARGYLNQSGLTDKKFIVNPFIKGSKVRMYKTGDIGRWSPDGNLEYLGRSDDQVKIRGYRIEPGEIESVIQQSEFVSQGVVLAKKDSSSHNHLVGYVVPNGFFDREGIVSYLKEKLPEYMIPNQWIELDSMPVTSNGKIDRKALLSSDTTKGVSKYVAPRNDLESKLASIWQELLEVEQVGINDNFFELGGHSLLAIQLISIIRKELQFELSLKDFFQFNTIYDLSKFVEIQINIDFQEKDLKEFDLLNI